MSLPARNDGQPIWVIVATTSTALEAEVIAGRLRSMGIPAVVHNDSPLSALGINFSAKVVVPEAYYEPAMTVLEPDESMLWLEDGLEDDDDDYYDDEIDE